jgi:flagellar basal-body rod protein FlgB
MSTISAMIEDSLVEALGRFLDVDVARYQLIATNLANIDTPRYRARDLDFRAELRRAAEASAMDERQTDEGRPSLASFGPISHLVRGLMERPDGNNVSLERESLLMAETQMKFNLAVQLLKDEFHTISTAINSGGTTS